MIPSYPKTRIEDTTDTLSGLSFPDPYHWLEGNSDEVRHWQRAQAAIASAYVREWPHFDRLRRLVSEFSTQSYADRYTVMPAYAGRRWFRTRIPDGASHSQAFVAEEPMGEGRLLFDPIGENPERPPFISWLAPSPDARTLALGVCLDGSENNTIRLIDVASGRLIGDAPPHVLMDGFTGGVQWLSDSSGFFFSAIAGAAVEFEQRVYLHRRLPVPTTIQADIQWTTATEYRWVVTSRDGHYAVAFERYVNPIPIAIAALGQGSLRWQPFITSIDGTVTGHLLGDRFFAVTDVGAPRGRLVAIAIDAGNPNDPQSWQEVIAESDSVLRSVTPVGDALYLTELVDTYARVRIVNVCGKDLGEVPLPDRGAIGVEWSHPMSSTLRNSHPDRFLFAFSSLTASTGLYSHTPGHEQLEALQGPQVRLEHTTVEDRWATSADGTRIPYHLVRRAKVSSSHPQPTLIFAYGGFNHPLVPQFPGPMAAFIAAGGIFVHAHLRGGGEFGREWWEGGRYGNKQNCYNDLYAIAEDLIANGRCTPQTLAVSGASNGGLTTGVAVTQRPDLWAAAVPRAPRLDLIGACRTGYGRLSTMEDRTSNISDPDEVIRLASFSPYHLVRDGVRYPAVYVDAGDTDPRCPPHDARKFAARLQAATASDAPILVHVWENTGHGPATDKDIAVNEHTEWLAFTMRQLGMGSWS